MVGIFIYTGKIAGKHRPRVRRDGWTYPDPNDVEYQQAIAAAYESQCGLWFGTNPVSVTIDIVRSMPKDRPRRIDKEPDMFKPDVDNVAKAVLDALNGVAFADDRQVVALTVRKHPRERVENESMRIVVATVPSDMIYNSQLKGGHE